MVPQILSVIYILYKTTIFF